MTDWYSFYRTRPARTTTTFRVYDRALGFYTDTNVTRHYNWDTGRLPTGARINQAYERQGFGDTHQPVWGWFSGGGWAFGRTENSTHRIMVETYTEYRTRTTGQELRIEKGDTHQFRISSDENEAQSGQT